MLAEAVQHEHVIDGKVVERLVDLLDEPGSWRSRILRNSPSVIGESVMLNSAAAPDCRRIIGSRT